MITQPTILTNAICTAGIKAQYDANVKNILANKQILAYILKYTTEEFEEYEIPDIISCIESPAIGEEPVYPGVGQGERIVGANTEDNIPNEGTIYFDIFFFAYLKEKKKGIQIKLYINVEAQKDYYPGYDLVTRSIYYCARELSKQYGVEFIGNNYDQIQKVYSIWICMNAPERDGDTITSYRIMPANIHGNYTGTPRYDLLDAVIIRLKEDKTKDSENKLIQLLTVLLSNRESVRDKIKILEERFAISATRKLGKELNLMCNLSDLVEERGIEKGIEKGIVQGILQITQKLIDMGWDNKTIMQVTGLEEGEIEEIRANGTVL